MPTINNLSALDSVTAGDQLPVYSTANGDARKASLTVLVTFLSTAFSSLTASSYLKVTGVSFANLPSAATAGAGARAFCTDADSATFNTVIAGGGANSVPVFSDGTDWRVG